MFTTHNNFKCVNPAAFSKRLKAQRADGEKLSTGTMSPQGFGEKHGFLPKFSFGKRRRYQVA